MASMTCGPFMPKTKTAPPPAQTAATPPPPAVAIATAGVRKVSLAGFARESAKPGGKSYPVLPDADGTIAELVASILEKSEQLEALTGSLDLEKAELRSHAAPFYFTHHHGQHTLASSIDCRDPKGRSVLVQMANSYKALSSDAEVVALIGGEHAAAYFRQAFEFKIKGDLIPEAAVEPLLAGLQALFAEHGSSAALTAKEIIKPSKDFHTARHSLLSVAENLELERVCPIIAKVTTKGRGEDK